MRYLIFGYDGLIGKELTKHIEGSYVGIEKDCSFKDIPKRKYDCIIHLAANCIIRDVIKNPELALENIQVTHDIFEYARKHKIKKIVYFSSSRVTNDEYNPYIVSKIYGEDLCKAYKDCYGIDYLIIRPETVWSIHDKHKRVIPNWIKAAKQNKPIIVYGNKNKTLSPIHVESFVLQFIYILSGFMDNNLSRREVGISGKPQRVETIINKIKKKYKSKSKVIYKEAEKTQPQKSNMNDVVVDDFERYLK
jgi:nucleoside-diphosphate-sugar epimerase